MSASMWVISGNYRLLKAFKIVELITYEQQTLFYSENTF